MTELKESIAYKKLVERDAHDFISNVNYVFNMVSPVLNEISIHFDNYTLHDVGHSLRVLDYMCKIAGCAALSKLSDLELAMIIFVALLHDIGMVVNEDDIKIIKSTREYKYFLEENKDNHKLALQDYIRPIHGELSYVYLINDAELKKHMTIPQLSTVNFIQDVALICQSHMESVDWINSNLYESFTRGQRFNGQYIAILLRMADIIDFDSQRAPEYMLNRKNLGYISLNEWKKHAVICNMDKIDNAKNSIFFDIECDDFDLYCKLSDTLDNINNEIKTCVMFASKFSDDKYKLSINDCIYVNMITKNFHPEKFFFTLDYYRVTELLMGENLYGDKKYGLREIIQNSFDACNLMKEIYKRNDPTTPYNSQVSIIFDYDDKLIRIKDNGTGMSKEVINKYFLNIGVSYYRSVEFEKSGYNFSPTGTFGIGFLSCFMLSEKVSICTKCYNNGETSSFSLLKGRKYICFENKAYNGVHGTEISLKMESFCDVFSKEEIIRFINNNFYKLDSEIKIYNKHLSALSQEGIAKATILTSGLNFDLSEYLIGVECKGSLGSFLEDYLLRRNPIEFAEADMCVLFSKDGVSLVDKDDICLYRNNYYNILSSDTAFEDLLNIFLTHTDDEIVRKDIEDRLDYFQTFGFRVFESDFEIYGVDDYEYDEDNIDLYEKGINQYISVIWDKSIDPSAIHNLLNESKLQFFEMLDVLRINWHEDNVGTLDLVKAHIMEDIYGNLTYSDDIYHTEYAVKICYRGVYLSQAKFIIKNVTKLFSNIHITLNINTNDIVPSVTRDNLTATQLDSLSYAVGRAIHLFLMKQHASDPLFKDAIIRFITRHYPTCNSLCKNIDIFSL